MDHPTSQAFHERAQKVMPGGVSSPVRALKAVDTSPVYITSASGAMLTDVEGNPYIDYIGSWGPMISGHAHPSVNEALEAALQGGTSFGTAAPHDVFLAEEIIKRVPVVEKVRFVNSGTEATMSALRLARAVTGRDVVIKFAGCYHGHGDSFLIQAGSGVATLGLPDSPGVTRGAAQDTRIATFNDVSSVETLFDAEAKNIAAVIVEPVAGNMGVVPPEPGFLEGLRSLCDRHGALLIFDEVMTGFRIARGGAVERYGVGPDLVTFGKVIGGGLPVGAYGGPDRLMHMIAPEGPVYQAGTLSGNPLAMTAGLATLSLLDEAAYKKLEQSSALLAEELVRSCGELDIPCVVNRVSSMLTPFFHTEKVTDMAQASRADHAFFAAFFRAMLARGVHLPPSGYESWFVSLAHDEEILSRTVEAARESLKQARAETAH